MDAVKFYEGLAEHYFNLVTKNKGVLPVAKAAYIVEIENLMQINQFISNEDAKKENMKKI
jgi:hypothetical protein